MKLDQKEFRKLTDEYIQAEKKYSDALSEYIVTYRGNEKPKPVKTLTLEAIERLKKLDEERLKVKKKWYEAI